MQETILSFTIAQAQRVLRIDEMASGKEYHLDVSIYHTTA